MTEKIPARKLPDIKISKEKMENLKTVSAMINMLAEDAELTKKIAEAFLMSTQADPKDKVVAQVELKEKVTKLVADKLSKIPADKIANLYPYWYPHIIQYHIPHVFMPHIIWWEQYAGEM